ncbi:MAG: mechanosensitive ion channel domain-containing protein [Phycisphaerae bacterium]|jgi:small-conductance mechanosensitive channel
MKKGQLITVISVIFLLTLWNCSCSPATAQSAKAETPAEETSANTSTDTNAPSEASVKDAEEQNKIKEAQEKAEQTKAEAEAAKKEAEIQEKIVELEKKKAKQKLKEAELAKKEVVAIKETAKTKTEVDEAVAKAQQIEKDALAAKEKVTLAEEKKLATQKRVEITEEELKLAMERAAVAEAKITENRKTTYKKLLQTGLIILIGYLLLFILVRIINRRVENLKARHLARRNTIYILNALIILYITFLWVQNIGAITIFISVTSAGLVLVLQDVILSVVGWFYILVHKPFEVGDRIEMGAVKGDVMDIALFQTSLLEIGNWVDADQSTGRIVNIPNSAVFKKETYNYSRGFEFLWNEIKILVTFESDWKRAEEIMLNYGTAQSEEMAEVVKRKIKKMTMHYMIYYEKLTPIVYVNIKDSGVELTLRYLTEARKRRTTQDALCRMILEDFEKEPNVNFAYPTYRIVK